MANLLTHLARGETALSITMSAVSSVLAVVTVPLYLGLAIAHFGVPGLAGPDLDGRDRGHGLRHDRRAAVDRHDLPRRRPAQAARSSRASNAWPSARSSWWPRERWSWSGTRWPGSFGDVAAAALTLNVAAMAVSFGCPRAARLGEPTGNRDLDGARDPQQRPGHRRGSTIIHGARHSRRRVQRVHVHHGRPVRPDGPLRATSGGGTTGHDVGQRHYDGDVGGEEIRDPGERPRSFDVRACCGYRCSRAPHCCSSSWCSSPVAAATRSPRSSSTPGSWSRGNLVEIGGVQAGKRRKLRHHPEWRDRGPPGDRRRTTRR